MQTLQEAKALWEEARTNYCFALANNDFQACITYKKLTAKRLAEVGKIVKAGMTK